jgi:UDP-N-acetylglucosamine 1-carboxyvinyltransferase
LVVASLSAEGTSVVNNIIHIERGYEALDKSLAEAGAKIKKMQTD